MVRKEMEFTDNQFDDLISKKNRRKTLEKKKHEVIVGPPPPTGVHKEDRRIRDKRRNLAVKEVLK